MTTDQALYDGIVRDLTDGMIQTMNDKQSNAKNEAFLHEPTHALAADCLYEKFGKNIIFERTGPKQGRFWQRQAGGYFEPMDTLIDIASKFLDEAVDKTFEELKAQAQGNSVSKLYMEAGAARKKARTRDFVNGALEFFAAKTLVPELSSRWNQTPECLPCLDGVIDFSGDEIKARMPKDGEYFRNPLPVKTADILVEDIPASFLLFLDEVFPDREVQRTALECLSLAVANKGQRTFYLWHGSGANGKNTLLDGLKIVLGTRVGTIPAGAIVRSQDGSGRFAAAALNGLTFAAVDEVTAPLNTSEIKRLTGNDTFSVEEKGRQAFEITQRWALVALTNRLPSFAPTDDKAYLERLIILPFDSVFYFNDEQRQHYIDLGVPAERLIQARDRDAIMEGFIRDRAQILRLLIKTYMQVRAAGGRPFEGKRSYQLKLEYRDANDLIADFFKEHFVRADGERVQYARILELYRDYTGDKNIATRTCIQKLTARFSWIEKKKTNGISYLVNIRERNGNDGEQDSSHEVSNSNESQKTLFNAESTSLLDTALSAEVPKNPILRSPIEKYDFSYVNIKKPVFSTSALEKEKSPLENDPAFADAEVCYLHLLQLHDERKVNLRNANLNPETARVGIDEWKLRCGAKGVLGQRFEQARALIEKLGMAKTEGAYIEPVEVKNE